MFEWRITAEDELHEESGTGPYITYTFDRKVDYTITLTVYDHPAEGTNDTLTRTISKEDVLTLPPTVTWEVTSGVGEGRPVTMRAWADDPHPAGMERLIEYHWNFGDQTVGNGPAVTHVYNKARLDAYVIVLTVIDEDDDATILSTDISVDNPPPVIAPVDPIVVSRGRKAETVITAEDATSDSIGLVYAMGAGPAWAAMEGNRLVVRPGSGVEPGTYFVTVMVEDVLGAVSDVSVPVVVTGEDVKEGVSWSSFLGVLVLFMLIFLVIAVLIASRMRPAKEAPPPARERTPYEDLYERPERRVRAVSKVESERIDVDIGAEEGAEVPTPVTAVETVPEPPTTAPEPEPEPEIPLPSWMTPPKPKEPEGVVLAEKEVEAPPEAPPEWRRPAGERPSATYMYRRQEPSAAVRYRGAGPPRRK
jgi:hypothetical protein